MSGVREVWVSLLRQLPPRPGPGKWKKMDGWMEKTKNKWNTKLLHTSQASAYRAIQNFDGRGCERVFNTVKFAFGDSVPSDRR